MKRSLTLAALLLAGCGGSHHPATTHQVLGAPGPAAGQCAPSDNHALGACQPAQDQAHRFGIVPRKVAGLHGLLIDLSNNDPVYGVGAYSVMRAHGVSELYVKLTEGTGFVDQTAARMAHDARAAGLRVGGYDFAHVCGDSAQAERGLFEQRRQATGANQLPGVLDAEYGGGCGSGWIQDWRRGGERTAIYTGNWWWAGGVGDYWPADAQAWISGYGVSYPAMPSGRSKLDSWQFSDHGYNGVSSADLSVGLLGATSPPPNPHLIALRRELLRDLARLRHLQHILPAVRRRYAHSHHPGRYLGTVSAIRHVETRIGAVRREIHHLGG